MSFTRKQALALLDWGKRTPEVIAAYSNPSHPGYAEAQQYAARLLEIANARGAPDDAGEPFFDAETFMTRFAAGEPAVRQRLEGVIAGDTAPAPLDRPLQGDDGLAELRSLTPAQAQERIAMLSANKDFGALLTKEKDPVATAGWDLLNSIAAGAGGGLTDHNAAAPQTDARRQLDEIYAACASDKDHPYNNHNHPQHQAMQEKVMQLTEATLPETAALPSSQQGGLNQ